MCLPVLYSTCNHLLTHIMYSAHTWPYIQHYILHNCKNYKIKMSDGRMVRKQVFSCQWCAFWWCNFRPKNNTLQCIIIHSEIDQMTGRCNFFTIDILHQLINTVPLLLGKCILEILEHIKLILTAGLCLSAQSDWTHILSCLNNNCFFVMLITATVGNSKWKSAFRATLYAS